MVFYKESQKIGSVFRGAAQDKKIYKGSFLVYLRRNFPAGQIVANSAEGNATGLFALETNQRFYVEMYGGGAGGSSSQRDSKWFYGPGAGGAGFAGIVDLPAGGVHLESRRGGIRLQHQQPAEHVRFGRGRGQQFGQYGDRRNLRSGGRRARKPRGMEFERRDFHDGGRNDNGQRRSGRVLYEKIERERERGKQHAGGVAV